MGKFTVYEVVSTTRILGYEVEINIVCCHVRKEEQTCTSNTVSFTLVC